MQRRFPELAALCGDTDDAVATYGHLVRLIGQTHAPAREAFWRSSLGAIGTVAAAREIAESDLREGIPYSSNVRKFPDIEARALPAILAHEAAYGAAVFTESWPSLSRGRALVHYFQHHPPQGRILHIAPEKEAEQWFRSGGHDYQTLGLGAQTDLAEDLTALPLEDATFDLILCHRVLEHIFDEQAALGEIRRVLKPGGILNISVPESMHLPDSLDWCIPDSTHHGHYRQYGSNFEAILQSAGFEVDCVDWLLRQPGHRLREAGTFPLRFYHASPGLLPAATAAADRT